MLATRPAPGSSAAKWEKWLKDEYYNKAKFEANLRLARALGLFFGAIYVYRNFGTDIFGP